MKTITSRENPFYKISKKVAASSRARKKSGKTLLDGIHLIKAYCDALGLPEAVMVSSSMLENPEIKNFLPAIPASIITVLSDDLFRELSTVETPTGISALIPIPQVEPPTAGSCVLLEAIQDPGNLGSILRSAAASSIGQVHLSPDCADAWSPKVLRAGMGAHFHLAIYENSNLINVAQNFPGQVVAMALNTENKLFGVDLRGPVAFVIGNEGAGISAPLLACAGSIVKIPMPGDAESLNAAAAAAICFFERVRQLDSDQ